MSDQDQQDKTEEPTERKLSKAREEGNVPKSTEVASAVLLLTAMLLLLYSGGWIYEQFRFLFQSLFMSLDQPFENHESALQILEYTLQSGFKILSPALFALLAAAIFSHVIQGGFILAPKVMEAKPERISPVKGFKKIFSVKGLAELVKGLSKVGIVGIIIYFTLRGRADEFASLMVFPIPFTLARAGEYILMMMSGILSAMIVLAIADAIYTRFQHSKDLRMTRQEVRDELRQSEGDPHMKRKRKEKAQSYGYRKRLDHSVLSSDVVITNPTHYAVALQYNPDSDIAPVVMVKGLRKRALKIRALATWYEIPVIENPPVARALYASTEEGQSVPEEHFQVVAEILAYVYRLKEEKNFAHGNA